MRRWIIDDLIARLEAASEGSEELNDAIDFELFGSDEARPYTTSLDAALTLVPEGWWLRSIEGCPQQNEWDAMLDQKTIPWGKAIGCANENVGSPTPALAVCIAALKARKVVD